MGGAADFPVNITCVAHSGCVVSNTYPGIPPRPGIELPPGEACATLAFNQTKTFHLLYSNDPTDGMTVLFDPNTTDAAYTERAGVSIVRWGGGCT